MALLVAPLAISRSPPPLPRAGLSRGVLLPIPPLHAAVIATGASSLRSVSPAPGLGVGVLRRRSRPGMGTVCYAATITTQTAQWVSAISATSVSPAPGLGLGVFQKRSRPTMGTVCYASPITTQTAQWASTVAATILMLAKGTAIQKSFLVPLVALQAPASVISWIKGEYGIWTAFLILLVRLFYFIPGELDLPFLTMLLVLVAPSQTMNLRGTQSGAIVSLAIAGFLAFQHFSRAGSLRRAFDQGSILATIGIICITVVPFLFLI